MTRFEELKLSSGLRNNLALMNISEPTPVQAEAIPPAMEGRNVVATAQTGTGKTLAFLLPLVNSFGVETHPKGKKNVSALILTPTRELAMQIQEVFVQLAKGMGLRAAVVVGGLSENTQLQEIRRGAQVIVATPGRLQDFLNRRLVDLRGVKTLILDEADRMLDMGFLPAIEEILVSLPEQRQTLFFSATIDRSLQPLLHQHVPNAVRVAIGEATRTADRIELHVYEIEPSKKVALLRHMLAEREGSFLVFARTKHGAERLAKRLSASGVKTAAIHGDRTQAQRKQALERFREGYYRVLVATDVAARGIHVDSIAHVVNFDLPRAADDFIHRAGRTGRAGQQGTATTFISSGERAQMRAIERSIQAKLQRLEVPEVLPEDVRVEVAEELPPPRFERQPRTHSPKPASNYEPREKQKKPRFTRDHFDRPEFAPKPKQKGPSYRPFQSQEFVEAIVAAETPAKKKPQRAFADEKFRDKKKVVALIEEQRKEKKQFTAKKYQAKKYAAKKQAPKKFAAKKFAAKKFAAKSGTSPFRGKKRK
jgi:ATP-dependent RNA helicase RhlE